MSGAVRAAPAARCAVLALGPRGLRLRRGARLRHVLAVLPLGQQGFYQPSYEKKLTEKNRKLRKEQQATARAYWTPVKQLEQSNAKLKAQGAKHTLSSSG